MARIFLSHSSKNNAEAIALRDWIVDGGWDEAPFLDLDPKRGIAAGERWERTLHHEAERCEAILFLISKEWLKSDWCRKEYGLAEKLNKRIFGILIDDVPRAKLPKTLMTTWQIVDLASGSDHKTYRVNLPDLSKEEHVSFSCSGLIRLKSGLDKAGLNPRSFAWPPENEPNRSPYPGLRPLGAEDAGIFFGREAPTVIVLDRLRGLREAAPPRLFVILGASGAGKSSFLRAGLIPRLSRDDANFLPLSIVRPDKAVITGTTGLIQSLHESFHIRNLPCNRAEIRTAVNAGASRLIPLLKRLTKNASALNLPGLTERALPTLVLPIDQGEELFLAEGAKEAQIFLALLKDIALGDVLNLIALFTIRSDSYERLQTAKALEGLRQETFALPTMPRGAYQTIIEGPAQRLNDSKRQLTIEPKLTQALLRDIEEGGGKDALPLLAFTLERLYREHGSDGDLLLSEYEALGGIKGSIQAAVDEALEAANSDPTIPNGESERSALLRCALIPALAGIDRETGTPRRRVARISEIPCEALGLIDCLVKTRLLVTDRVRNEISNESETLIEPAHEALLRQWDTLRDWLKDDSATLLSLESVRAAARDWQSNNKSNDWLSHRSGRLDEAERLLKRQDFARFIETFEREYLDACRAQENERLDHQREEARKLAEQTSAALRNETVSLAALSTVALNNGRPVDAIQLALAAWPREGDDNRPQMRLTINALSSALASHRERLLFKGHGHDAVWFSAFSPSGTYVVSAASDKTARLWDAKTSALVRVLEGHDDGVIFVMFSPDSTQLVTASFDKTARIWDAATGTTLKVLEGHSNYVRSASFSSDGARIVTASFDKTARIWDRTTGMILNVLEGHGAPVNSAKFSPDDTRIVTASYDKTIRIWDVSTGTVLDVLEGHDGEVVSAAFSLDGTRILTASWDKTARIWDATTGTVLKVLAGHDGPLLAAAFSPDGTRITTASSDKAACIWDAMTGVVLAELKGHDGEVGSASFSPDGAHIVTSAFDKTVRIWDATTNVVLAEVKGLSGHARSVSFSPDGVRIASCSPNNTVLIWNAATGAVLKVLEGHDGHVASTSFSQDGTRIVTAGFDKTTRIWDATTGVVLKVFNGHEGPVLTAQFSPDGTRIVTASRDWTARIWDVRSNSFLKELQGHRGEVVFAAFSPDSTRIVTASWDNTVRVWDSETGETLTHLEGHGGQVNSAMFSPDGRRIVTASFDKTVRLWDATTGATLAKIEGHGGTIWQATFSPEGARILTASSDKTARIWDAVTCTLLTNIEGYGSQIIASAFSPDGRRVVTASQDGTARVWHIPPLEYRDILNIAFSRLGNNTDLTDLAKRYGLAELKPICGNYRPHPVDWSKLQD